MKISAALLVALVGSAVAQDYDYDTNEVEIDGIVYKGADAYTESNTPSPSPSDAHNVATATVVFTLASCNDDTPPTASEAEALIQGFKQQDGSTVVFPTTYGGITNTIAVALSGSDYTATCTDCHSRTAGDFLMALDTAAEIQAILSEVNNDGVAGADSGSSFGDCVATVTSATPLGRIDFRIGRMNNEETIATTTCNDITCWTTWNHGKTNHWEETKASARPIWSHAEAGTVVAAFKTASAHGAVTMTDCTWEGEWVSATSSRADDFWGEYVQWDETTSTRAAAFGTNGYLTAEGHGSYGKYNGDDGVNDDGTAVANSGFYQDQYGDYNTAAALAAATGQPTTAQEGSVPAATTPKKGGYQVGTLTRNVPGTGGANYVGTAGDTANAPDDPLAGDDADDTFSWATFNCVAAG